MRDAPKSLKEDESIMVLLVDKGRASVVMDTDTYRAKMSTLIENGPYQLLNKDPTDCLTCKLSEKLLTLKRGGYLSDAVCNKIRPLHKQPPRINGLLKIHKHLCIWFILLPSQHLVFFNRKLRAYGNQFSSLRIHRQQWDDPRQRDHGIFRRRVAVYQRSYRRRCTSRTAETREWPLPCRPHHANAYTDRWPFDPRTEIYLLPV